MPFIYKTKGTEASINAIISCFGIPKNLIKIKEYGGIDSLVDGSDKSYYIFENTKYEPYFSGSGEYFEEYQKQIQKKALEYITIFSKMD